MVLFEILNRLTTLRRPAQPLSGEGQYELQYGKLIPFAKVRYDNCSNRSTFFLSSSPYTLSFPVTHPFEAKGWDSRYRIMSTSSEVDDYHKEHLASSAA